MEMYEGSLHLLFFHSFGHIYRLHSQRVHLGIIHAGGQGARRGVKILDLLGLTAGLVDPLGHGDGVVQGAAGVGGHQIRNEVLFLPQLLIHLLIFLHKPAVNAVFRFSHPLQYIIGNMLRSHFKLAADMVLAKLL